MIEVSYCIHFYTNSFESKHDDRMKIFKKLK